MPPTVAISAYIEAFYQYDERVSSFELGNAVLDVTGTTGAVSAHVVTQVGQTASLYYASEPQWTALQQAVIGYKRGDTLAEAGIFLSPIGIEGLAVKDQWNWSRSNVFVALPTYHAGVRVTRPLTAHVTAAAMVTNGWNQVEDGNRSPSVGAQLTYSPGPELTAQVVYFGGIEEPTGSAWRHLVDATATYHVTHELSVAAQADAGYEDSELGVAKWADGAAYARVRPMDDVYVAARADWMHERETGAAPRLFFPAGDLASGTLTLDVRPDPGLSVRLEARYDHATTRMYERSEVSSAKSQQTVILGATAWF